MTDYFYVLSCPELQFCTMFQKKLNAEPLLFLFVLFFLYYFSVRVRSS